MKDYRDHSQTKECGENCYHGRGILPTERKGWKAIQGRGVEGRSQKEMRDTGFMAGNVDSKQGRALAGL